MAWSTKKMTRCGTCSLFSKAKWRSKTKLISKILCSEHNFGKNTGDQHLPGKLTFLVPTQEALQEVSESEHQASGKHPIRNCSIHLGQGSLLSPQCQLQHGQLRIRIGLEGGLMGPWWAPTIHYHTSKEKTTKSFTRFPSGLTNLQKERLLSASSSLFRASPAFISPRL